MSVNRTEWAIGDEQVHAETQTGSGATLKLVGRKTPGGWREFVVAESDGTRVRLDEGKGLYPSQVYNQLAEVWVDD
jgi:hypothetical protein